MPFWRPDPWKECNQPGTPSNPTKIPPSWGLLGLIERPNEALINRLGGVFGEVACKNFTNHETPTNRRTVQELTCSPTCQRGKEATIPKAKSLEVESRSKQENVAGWFPRKPRQTPGKTHPYDDMCEPCESRSTRC